MRAPGTLATRAEQVVLRERRAAARLLCVTPDFESAALALGLLEPGGLERILARADGPRGRARTALVSLPGRAERLHFKPVVHGGWLAPLLRDRWLRPRRPLRELRTHAALRAAGAPVPVPVLVAARRGGLFYRAALATVHEEESLDGAALLASGPSPAARRCAAAAAGAAVRLFHDAGGRHADLHLRNLLFRRRDGDIEAWLVDLDRARAAGPLGAGERMADLMRLYRSLEKLGLLEVVGARGCASFLAAYTAGDRALRRDLLRFLPRERARIALHRLGWRIARAARGSSARSGEQARLDPVEPRLR
jgi:tRNA A-37 threonylcarbamoyl transferase component Bud32